MKQTRIFQVNTIQLQLRRVPPATRTSSSFKLPRLNATGDFGIIRRMNVKRQMVVTLAGIALLASLAADAAVSIENAGTLQSAALPAFADMSGISWAGTNATFYVVRDGGAIVSNGCYLHRMTVQLDNRGRMTTRPHLSDGLLLDGAHDAEGIARDPLTGTIWVSDEYDTSIREYDPETGKPTGQDVEIPPFIVKGTRSNLSLESLTISPDGRTMWTANEEALIDDGLPAVSSTNRMTTVRLLRFNRLDAFDSWKLSGMWAYPCDPVGKNHPVNSGVSDLCALPDGSLLVLERECSYETLGLTRIYRPNFAGATDVREMPALTNSHYTAVSKGEPLYTATDGKFFTEGLTSVAISCYEGLGLGPRNPDGTYNLMMVSDGGAIANKRWMFLSATAKTQAFIRALRLYGLDDDGSFSVLAPQGTLVQSSSPGERPWRIGLGGFGRGGIRTDLTTFGRNNRADLYGVELDFQRNLLQSGKYDLWLGVGGAYTPRQNGAFADNAAKLGAGEFRLLTIPQRHLTDDLALGMRLGASFNWLNVKSSTTGGTAFRDSTSSDTQFAAQAILGVQATYMLTDRIGLYGNFDWRLGDESTFTTRSGESSVDMSGWLWSTGAVLTF